MATVRRFSKGPPPLITQDRKPGEFNAEENSRAYQLFKVLDQDSSGKISTHEFKHFLAGRRTTFDVEFDTSDVGIVFGLNALGDVVIVELELHSPAAAHDMLMLGLQLMGVNSYEVGTNAEHELQKVQSEMQRSLDKPTTFTFLDPLMVIRNYSRTVDIQVDKRVFTLSLNTGAINNYATFLTDVNHLLKSTNPVAHIQIEMIKQQQSTIFAFYSTNGEPFRLLWATGPTHGESMRYNLGFSALDTPLSSRHEGLPTSIVINLELTEGQLDILIAELFRMADGGMREELEFEEFRRVYIKHFDTRESIESLKEWAQWKFQFAALENEMIRQKSEQRLRKERMIKRRDKNAAIYRAQKAIRMKKMFVGSDGVPRVQRRLPPSVLDSDDDVTVARAAPTSIAEPELSDDTFSVASLTASCESRTQRVSMRKRPPRKTRARAAKASETLQPPMDIDRLADRDTLDQSAQHPSAFKYTHEQIVKDKSNDVHSTHPVFFTAECIREARRKQPHSVELIRKILRQGPALASIGHTVAWTTYPSPPISVGLVKRKFRDVSKAYDDQKVCHPAIFGYRARWQSHTISTSQFTHPTFWGYSLDRPNAAIGRAETSLRRKANPFRYLPGQPCVICGGGAPGCPMCWDPPSNDMGILLDEAFNKKKEKKRKSKKPDFREQKLETHSDRGGRNRCSSWESERAGSLQSSEIEFSFGSMEPTMSSIQTSLTFRSSRHGTVPLIGIDDSSSDDDQSDHDLASLAESSVSALSQLSVLHTKLTTIQGVRDFRELRRAYIAIWIKAMPSGKVVKVYADKRDPVWHVYNMYQSSVSDGVKRGGVLVLACSQGVYPLDNGRVQESDVSLGYYAYKIQLKAYGLTNLVQDVALLRFENISEQTVVAMLSRYLRQNFLLNIDLENLPLREVLATRPDLQAGQDPVQMALLHLLKGQYAADRETRRREDGF